MSPVDRPDYRLADLIAGVNRRLEAEIEARLKPDGISIEQFRILRTLAVRDGQPMGALAEAVLVDSPTLTKIVDRMVAGAAVYRAPDPKDRRKVLVFLSDKGRALYGRLARLAEAPETGLIERLGDEDADALKLILTQLMLPT